MIELRCAAYRHPGGRAAALSGVTLRVAGGEFLVICGANGSGKSTLLLLMAGLLPPDSGVVLVGGRPAGSPEGRRRVGLVFQDADCQIVGETVAEDAAFGPENLGLSPPEVAARVRGALDATSLSELADALCHELSGGEKRRLALAGILAMRPEAVLLDEPLAHLDYPGTRAAIAEIEALKVSGATVVLATHEVEKVAHLADRVAVLSGGVVAALGSVAEVAPLLSGLGVRPPVLRGGSPEPWG